MQFLLLCYVCVGGLGVAFTSFIYLRVYLQLGGMSVRFNTLNVLSAPRPGNSYREETNSQGNCLH